MIVVEHVLHPTIYTSHCKHLLDHNKKYVRANVDHVFAVKYR
jgi:hypothetical protein